MIQLNQEQLHHMYVNNSYIVTRISDNNYEDKGYIIQSSMWESGGEDGTQRYYTERLDYCKNESELLETIYPLRLDNMEWKVKSKSTIKKY